MAYENQEHCVDCGISIPPVHEAADPDALLCDTCLKHRPMNEIISLAVDLEKSARYSEIHEWGDEDASRHLRARVALSAIVDMLIWLRDHDYTPDDFDLTIKL